MTSYREILRLSAQGISQRSIARSCGCSRNTVARVLAQAQQSQIEWSKIRDLTDGDLYQPSIPRSDSNRLTQNLRIVNIFTGKWPKVVSPSVYYGMNTAMQCRINHEIPLKYTQYCYYYRQFALTTKATMHIRPQARRTD